MKRATLVALVTAALMASSFALASAQDAAKAAPGKAGEAKKSAVEKKPQIDPAIAAIDAQIEAAKIDRKAADWKTHLSAPKQVKFTPGKKYFVKMDTSEGPILIRMLTDNAPMHVTSFLYLVRMGFYDGLNFHRVIPGFMAQGGDPIGNGTGGPGYQFAGEFSGPEKFDRPGLLAQANAGPGTDGSQFFITFAPTQYLNGKHTIFGEVTQGMDVLKKLEANGSRSGATTKKMSITKCTVEML
jgi:peptidyl-prolyl cis-trans isomerase B (cyclophilin B)